MLDWSDKFGETRRHNVPPATKRAKPPVDLMQLVPDVLVGLTSDNRILSRLDYVVEQHIEQCVYMSDNAKRAAYDLYKANIHAEEEYDEDQRFKWKVYTSTKHELLRTLIKLKIPLVQFPDPLESVPNLSGDLHWNIKVPGPGKVMTTVQPNMTYLTGGYDPLHDYGWRYLMDGNGRHSPLYACCLQVPESRGCLIGYKDMSRNVPYQWFGGFKDFDILQYNDIVTNCRGVVFKDANLSKCNQLHEKIVSILTSEKVKKALIEEQGQNIYKRDILVELWTVAECMHEYNAPLFPLGQVKTYPTNLLSKSWKRDMIAYVKLHLPTQLWKRYDEYVQQVKDQLTVVAGNLKKQSTFTDTAKKLIDDFTALKKLLEEAEADNDVWSADSLFDGPESVLSKYVQ